MPNAYLAGGGTALAGVLFGAVVVALGAKLVERVRTARRNRSALDNLTKQRSAR